MAIPPTVPPGPPQKLTIKREGSWLQVGPCLFDLSTIVEIRPGVRGSSESMMTVIFKDKQIAASQDVAAAVAKAFLEWKAECSGGPKKPSRSVHLEPDEEE